MTHLVAPAKLTWTLEVLGRREDGLHELRAEMTTLGLADGLDLTEGEGIEVVGPYADAVSTGEDNLVARALRLAGRHARVRIDKRIPVGGGLGGGSADAAAILRWAGVSSVEAALGLGSDVPFCLTGGRALVEGVGERVSALADLVRPVTLFLAPFSIPTGPVYRAFDEMWETGWRPRGANHLEEPARRVEPRLGPLMESLREEFGPSLSLAGSGSSLVVEGHRAMGRGELLGCRLVETQTLGGGHGESPL